MGPLIKGYSILGSIYWGPLILGNCNIGGYLGAYIRIVWGLYIVGGLVGSIIAVKVNKHIGVQVAIPYSQWLLTSESLIAMWVFCCDFP